MDTGIKRQAIKMLKYGMYAKAVELLCFKQALARLAEIYPDMDMKKYKRSVKREYKEMLLRTPDIGGSSLEMNLYIAAFVFSLHKAEPDAYFLAALLSCCPRCFYCLPESLEVIFFYWSFCHIHSPSYILLFPFLVGYVYILPTMH